MVFASQHVVLSHNLGHFSASLLNVFGMMSKEVAHDLQCLDKETLCSSKRKHILAEAARVAHRLKVSTVGASTSARSQPSRTRRRGSGSRPGASGAYDPGFGN